MDWIGIVGCGLGLLGWALVFFFAGMEFGIHRAHRELRDARSYGWDDDDDDDDGPTPVPAGQWVLPSNVGPEND